MYITQLSMSGQKKGIGVEINELSRKRCQVDVKSAKFGFLLPWCKRAYLLSRRKHGPVRYLFIVLGASAASGEKY